MTGVEFQRQFEGRFREAGWGAYKSRQEYTWIFHSDCKPLFSELLAGWWKCGKDGKSEPPGRLYGLPVRMSTPLFEEFKRFAIGDELFVLIPTAHIDGFLQSVRDFSERADWWKRHALGGGKPAD